MGRGAPVLRGEAGVRLGSVTRLRGQAGLGSRAGSATDGRCDTGHLTGFSKPFLTVKWGTGRTLQGWLLSLLSEIILVKYRFSYLLLHNTPSQKSVT